MHIENIEALNSDGGKYIYKGIMNAHWRDLNFKHWIKMGGKYSGRVISAQNYLHW